MAHRTPVPPLPPPVEAQALRLVRDGRALLDGIDLTLRPGSVTALLGPNGAGKSLLLRLLHGLISPTAGTLARAHPTREAMLFQRPALLRRSALANVRFAIPQGTQNPDAIALDRLTRVGLAHLARRPARVLSGGEQQRVALARAWARDPLLLYLDEPTASLDPSATHSVEAILRAIHATGTTSVIATHDLGQARRLADRVVLLHRGRVVEDSDAATFFASPHTEQARSFLRGDLLL